MKPQKPPQWATRLLTWYCRSELLEDLQGDLNEYFDRHLEERGAFMARLIYVIDVLKFMRWYTLRKPQPQKRNVMIASYVKTSGRTIMRNKFFSGINIIGLSISMSVGLLAIAVVTDLFSYDGTLKNRDRIYRVVSTLEPTGQSPMELATASWKAGTLVRQEAPGIESIAILRREFGGDAHTSEGIVPVSGMYASEGFFDVFSYPLLEGVAATALKEPHSLVLTRTTAKKLFGKAEPMGQVVRFDTLNYVVTGVMEDIPKLSHMHFEMLVSLSSIDVTQTTSDGAYMDWGNVFSNYVYVLLSKNMQTATFTAALNRIDKRENAPFNNQKIWLSLQPLKRIVIGKPLVNDIAPLFGLTGLLVICGLAFVIILSACFNYTNLSIARSLKRAREVGVRKVIGAQRGQLIGQFVSESVIISLLSLCFAILIFFVLRGQFLSLFPGFESTFSLGLSPRLLVYFILLAVVVGVVAGILPSLFYSKINAVQVLKDASSMKVFRHISLRKSLIVIQYTLSLIFITATIIGYNQYKSFLRFDLGFKTDNIVNIDLQGNKDEVFVKELSALPAVKAISKSLLVSSLGSLYGSKIKYKDPMDSDQVDLNYIDQNYLPLHQYVFLAGRNLTPKPAGAPASEAVVNEELIRRFAIGHNNLSKAIGETVTISGKKVTIVGVLKDFHYGTLERKIFPTALLYSADPGRYLNVKITGADLSATLTSIETLWKGIDKVHPLEAQLYDEEIEHAYTTFSVMLKVIGFFAILAICISSLGLFGMVIYTMEKRVKEMSIRKVLGASEGVLMYLLSKGFLYLLILSAVIALPVTWMFMDKVVLSNIAYHQPIQFKEIFLSLSIVAGIALVMIGIQTWRIVRASPARVLKEE